MVGKGNEKVRFSAERHDIVYESMTETLIFGKSKYERMDMAFVSKISSMDYGLKNLKSKVNCRTCVEY